jgi:uncharacterized OB-fold protein
VTEPEEKPRPPLRGEEAPYYAAAADGRLVLQRCPSCERIVFYPRTVCPHCHTGSPEWIDASGRGRVYSFSVLHRAGSPGFEADVPYVVALVDLEEGVRMLANVVNVPAEEVEIGMPVTATFERRAEDFVVPQFEPAR